MDICTAYPWGIEGIKDEARARKVDIVMYGHTHKPHLEYCWDGLRILNPGSLSYPRQEGRKPSYMLMELTPPGRGPFYHLLSGG